MGNAAENQSHFFVYSIVYSIIENKSLIWIIFI